MNSRSAVGATALLLLGLAGCAINQTVRPVGKVDARQVCIIDSPSVRPGFLESYKKALAKKGYTVRQLPPSAAVGDCPLASTYTGRWQWDMALYLAYAEIKVYSNGQPAGEATYDATSGAANMAKFIDADKKIDELVGQLFP